MIPTFSDKVKEDVCYAQHGMCLKVDCLNSIHSIHHKLPNTKHNRKKFPLFIQSPFNAAGLCGQDHDQNPHLFKITEKEAEVYEQWLKEKDNG